MKFLRFSSLATCAMLLAASGYATEPLFRHTFESPADVSGKYTGAAKDGAVLETFSGVNVVSLGEGGYFDFGEALGDIISRLSGDYTISVNLFIPVETPLSQNGNFIFNFGKSSSTGYLFFGANQSRFSITETSYQNEQTTSVNEQFPKGEWVNLVIVQKGNDNSIYFNGVCRKTASISLHPATLGKTTQNWLGKSPYNGDVMLKNARYADFRIYNEALADSEIAELAADKDLASLNADCYETLINESVAGYDFDFSEVRDNLRLPLSLGNGVMATWTSSNPDVIANDGKVTRPAQGKPDAELTLSLTASKGNVSKTFSYPAKVIAMLSDKESAEFDLARIKLQGNSDNLRSSIQLPGLTAEGSHITWKSSDEEFLSHSGKVKKLSEPGADKKEVMLTATAEKNGVKATRDFTVRIAHPEEYDSYLFVYFPSNDNENLYYALSNDGYKYTAMNGGKQVMASDTVAIKKGIRDPHILRGVDGKTFYMVATDMKCSEGWASNRGMVLYSSTDLINWKHSTVHFPDRFPEWKNVTRVWAPEVIWDQNYVNKDGSKGRYLIYYSLLTNDGKCEYDKVYYSYANDDFTDLLTEPEFFYDRGSATIDCDIIYNEADGLYHMFYKNEGSGGICKVTAERLTPEPGQPAGSQWKNPSGLLQQTTEAVEGAGIFRLINTDTYVLMYDCYLNGHYQFCASDDLENFRLVAQTATSGAFTPRHGTVLPITEAERENLLKAFPTTFPTPTLLGARNPSVRTDNVATKAGGKYHVPVYPGTDLSDFDPMLIGSAGSTVSPEGPQDFSDGKEVKYTVTQGEKTKEYSVYVDVEANPVLPGFNADPEVLYSHKTGRFYIYPTSDGVRSWGGHTFNVWSSADLVNWHKENCILDLATNDVTWATGNAWAPCIEEKLIDGEYKYFFYFSGHNPDKNYKTLGCAIADSPTGPFRDLGTPMIDTNIVSGQLIDSDVFTDPVSGDTFFYWGNGRLVASRMNADMTSVSEARDITPAGGTNSTHAFREGVYVFYREGKYYFLWSVDDTGATNYHVAYGTSDSPLGPITVAESPVILIQKSSDKIYGTGHNSIVQIPGRDEWYIVYHRINKSFLNDGPGYHREVCIDKMEFNEDGTIKKVTPTHAGIKPVDLNADPSGIEMPSIEQGNAEVVSSLYYSLDGIFLGNTVPSEDGCYIHARIFSNGKASAEKIYVGKK